MMTKKTFLWRVVLMWLWLGGLYFLVAFLLNASPFSRLVFAVCGLIGGAIASLGSYKKYVIKKHQ